MISLATICTIQENLYEINHAREKRMCVADLVSIRVRMACQLEGLALDGLQVLTASKGMLGSVCTAQASRIGYLLWTIGKEGEGLPVHRVLS